MKITPEYEYEYYSVFEKHRIIRFSNIFGLNYSNIFEYRIIRSPLFEIHDNDFADVTKNFDDCIIRKFEDLEGDIDAIMNDFKTLGRRRGGGFDIRCSGNPR